MENTQLKTKPVNAIGVMQEEQADSPCKKIYFVVQLMYISDEPHKLHGLFFDLVRAVQAAAPSMSLFIASICEGIMNNDYLGALNETSCLIGYEQKIIARA
jgi:flagellar protein FlbT